MTTTTTGERINMERRDKQVSIKELARETFIPETTLRRKLEGVVEFTFDDVRRIARVLGVAPSLLVPDDFQAVAS